MRRISFLCTLILLSHDGGSISPPEALSTAFYSNLHQFPPHKDMIKRQKMKQRQIFLNNNNCYRRTTRYKLHLCNIFLISAILKLGLSITTPVKVNWLCRGELSIAPHCLRLSISQGSLTACLCPDPAECLLLHPLRTHTFYTFCTLCANLFHVFTDTCPWLWDVLFLLSPIKIPLVA